MRITASLLALCTALTSTNVVEARNGGCNADGCLRALLPTRDLNRFASGASFCATYIVGPPRTDISGAPAAATKSCGSKPSAYSSACTCIPILPTPTLPL